MTKKSSTKDFIQKARKVHGGKYDYSCTVYKTVHEYIEYICPIHGKVLQEANSHLQGHGCPHCSYGGKKGNVKSIESFIEQAQKVHGNYYLYDKVKYIGWDKDVEIICPKHGSFFQSAYNHIRGFGCRKCGYDRTHDSNRNTKDGFIKKAKRKHGDMYDYSLVKYKSCHDPVKIICKKHGIFEMTPTSHLLGHNCPNCVSEKMSGLRRSTTKDFIENAKRIHKDAYDYSKVDYIDRNSPVAIICHKHGVFYQTPNTHLAGCCCPFCKQTKGEATIEDFLKVNGIEYIKEFKIPNTSLFCDRKYLLVDFYLPQINTFIEYNGQQHYYPVSIYGGEDVFKMQVERDITLRQYCVENKITLIEIPYTKRNEIEKILTRLLTQKRTKK